MDRTIKIIEQGNGIDGIRHGSRVYDAQSGDVLKLTSSPGSLHTDDSRGNYRIATAEVECAAGDMNEAEFSRLPDALVADVDPTIAVGARVSGGEVGTEDHDTGRVIESSGDRVMVAWDSGVTTPADADSLTVET